MGQPRPRRLALVVAPQPGESFASWIDRMATDMALPPGRVADAIGVSNAARATDGRPLLFGVALSALERTAIHAATGVAPATLDAMQLAAYDGTVLDLHDLAAVGWARKARSRQWALFGHSRACPQCLAESGGVWPLWWRLGLAVVCPAHRRLLLDTCPTCEVPLRRGTTTNMRVLSRTLLVAPSMCGSRINGRVQHKGCEQRLDELVAEAADRWLIDVQAAYLRAAGGAAMTLAGQRLSGAAWFACLRAVVCMARAAATHLPLPPSVPLPDTARRAFLADITADWRRSSGVQSPASRPPTAALTASLLVFAAPVVLTDGRAGLVEAIRPIAEALLATRAHRKKQGNSNGLLRAVAVPTIIDQARLLATPRRNGVVAHLGPFARSPAARPALLEHRHIPQVVTTSDYHDLIAEFLPDTLPRTGRRYTALALARLCGATTQISGSR
ncbi:MAG: TniQ family protein [Micromonosporaceae bacterium]|nr:TniQ family protein [Micromonosporaceae bacterium]